MKEDDQWKATTWKGSQQAKLEDFSKLTEAERFKLLCDLYETFKDSLPPRIPHPFGGIIY